MSYRKNQLIDEVGLLNFRDAMQAKLSVTRQKGRQGWDDSEQCSIQHLRELLAAQMKAEKPDMVDVGNFAMMIWNREQFGG